MTAGRHTRLALAAVSARVVLAAVARANRDPELAPVDPLAVRP